MACSPAGVSWARICRRAGGSRQCNGPVPSLWLLLSCHRVIPVTPPWLLPSGDPSLPTGSAVLGWARPHSALCWEGSSCSCPRAPFSRGGEIPSGITGSELSPTQPHLPGLGIHRGMEVGRGHSVGANWGCELSLETPF